MGFIGQLRWRGMIQDITPGAEKFLEGSKTAGYIGYDPTAPSLTVGNLASVMMLVHLQRANHKAVALLGGATGMIGDPSGKDEERKLLDEEVLKANTEKIEKELRHLLGSGGKDGTAIINNIEWFGTMGFLTFLRDAGKHLTVSYMMSKESVKRRLETGISFTEFSYQALQAEDYYRLSLPPHNCRLQMGGSDQWGNILSGIEMIRRRGGGEAHGITCPLITRSDGTKFGKSEGENIWLNRDMTSPYKFYQFWLNATDDEAARYIRIFTMLEKEEIEALEKKHAAEPHLRLLQNELARRVTSFVHTEDDVETAQKSSSVLFGEAPAEALMSMSEGELLEALEGVPRMTVGKTELEKGVDVITFLADKTRIFPSKGEARRTLQGGGISINKVRISDAATVISSGHLLNGKYILVQRGKKNHYLVTAG